MQIYFAVVGLDLLGALDSVDRARIISYVYSLQVAGGGGRSAGFMGSPYLGSHHCAHSPCCQSCLLFGSTSTPLSPFLEVFCRYRNQLVL
jgi:hypothetical protein